MEGSALRSLAREYRRGELSRADYRTRRRQLIHDLTSRRIPLTYAPLHPPVRRSPALRRGFRVAALSMILLAGGLTAWLLLVQPERDLPAATDRAPAQSDTPGARRLERFLETNDWSRPRLDSLTRDWSRMTAFQKEQTRRTFWYRRFGNELKTRIRENAALARLEDDGKVRKRLHTLRETARAMGIDLPGERD